jgi:hypothetical protein
MQLHTHMHTYVYNSVLQIIMCKCIYTVDSEPVVHALAVKHTVCICNNQTETPTIRITNKDGYQDYQNER